MAQFSVKIQHAGIQATEEENLVNELDRIADEVNNIGHNLAFKVSSKSNIRVRIKIAKSSIDVHKNAMVSMKSALSDVLDVYERNEQQLVGHAPQIRNPTAETTASVIVEEKDFLEVFTDEIALNYGWDEILAGAGYIGTIRDLINDIKNGKTWEDFAESGMKVYDFISEAVQTLKRYKKIGNAVGKKTAMAWWAKSITGLKPLGRASTAKNPVTRFVNNLTNKTSPFNAQFKNIIKDFKGGNGVGKAVASWASVAVTGVTNWFSNKEEQNASGGTMSDGRVIAETITETVIDTALTYGTNIVVGAAVTTALGTVAAPGVLVVAASGLIVAGVNAGVKALTGKNVTEWASDAILDAGEVIGNAVGNAAKKVSGAIGSWFKKLSFA
ncbi:MAG: hypothetical protein J6A08_12665 [Lachnospiraceae bacterium]|nr:hypothetical protein [Lachnospiraceae bacterium]